MTASAQTPSPDPAPVPPPPAPAPASPPPPTTSPSRQAPTKTRPVKKKRAKTLQQPSYTARFHAPFAEMDPFSAVQNLPMRRAGRLVGVSLRVQQPEVNILRTVLMPLLVLCAVALLVFIPLALGPARMLGRTSTRAGEPR